MRQTNFLLPMSFNKIKKIPINPYIINWMIDFLNNRRQRAKVDGVTTEFLDINRGVPQGTVLGPIYNVYYNGQ
jgi:hypothetical protein